MVWPTERERDWGNAMREWWYRIERMRDFEKKHLYRKNGKWVMPKKYSSEYERMDDACNEAAVMVGRFKAK